MSGLHKRNDPVQTLESNTDDIPKLTPAPFETVTKLTAGEAQAAAKASGLAQISVRKVNGVANFGKYLEQLGSINIGRGYLLANIAQLDEAKKFVQERLKKIAKEDLGKPREKDEDGNPIGPTQEEVEVDYLKVQATLFDASTRAIEVMIKSTPPAPPIDNKPRTIPFAPGQIVQPPQAAAAARVDIHIGNGDKETAVTIDGQPQTP